MLLKSTYCGRPAQALHSSSTELSTGFGTGTCRRFASAYVSVIQSNFCMTSPSPPLSVRLDAELTTALDAYCARAGVTRSYAIQESLAQYLVSRQGPTLSSLAEALLPPLPEAPPANPPRESRQIRYREHVREKRRR